MSNVSTIHILKTSKDGLPNDPTPLIVDLDGTLTKSDTMHEGLLSFISAHPAKIPKIVAWLTKGKAAFKDKLAEQSVVAATSLPMRKEVLDHIAEARQAKRTILLVSASNHRQVSEIGAQTGLFDEAIGSTKTRNLAGEEKARWLVERFGEKGFDYIGDSKADLPVWASARNAYIVGSKRGLFDAAQDLNPGIKQLVPDDAPSKSQGAQYLKAMRPHQWLKNILVMVPALAAHDFSALLPAFIAFIAFSLAASSVYLINDMLDLEADRRHSRKCERPFASGAIPVAHGMIHAAALFLVSMLIAVTLAPSFLLVLLVYLALTFAYSLILKRKLMIDIWTLGTLYTIRIVAGGMASGVPLSEWLLAFSMFLFLSLAAVKRMSELADLKSQNLESIEGRGYRVSDLPVVLGVVLSSGYCSVVILSLYISNADVAGRYGEPKLLWTVCLMLLYWISRATIISFRGEMHDDPIVFALRDRISLFVFACCGTVFLISAML